MILRVVKLGGRSGAAHNGIVIMNHANIQYSLVPLPPNHSYFGETESMKSALIKSIVTLTGVVALGICFTGLAEAMSLGKDRINGRVVGFGNNSIDNEVEGGQAFGFNARTNISRILWSGTESTGDFSVRLFTFDTPAPLATLTGNISSFVKPVRLYGEPTVVDASFYTLSLDTPFSLDAGGYVLSIRNTADWGWTRVDRGVALFRFDAVDLWSEDNMSSGEFDLQVKDDTASPPTQEIPTPALLPGLIGLGVASIRKLRKEAAINMN